MCKAFLLEFENTLLRVAFRFGRVGFDSGVAAFFDCSIESVGALSFRLNSVQTVTEDLKDNSIPAFSFSPRA